MPVSPATPAPIRPEELKRLLDGLSVELFRLEARQTYLVPEEAERLRAYREGKPVPPRLDEELELVQDLVTAGVRVRRVHIVEQPLSEYVRFELSGYQDEVLAGAKVYLADRLWYSGFADLRDDFLLLDNQIVVWVRYDDDGRFLGWERDDSPLARERCRRQREMALAEALPLNDFLKSSSVQW